MDAIKNYDSEIFSLITQEEHRQQEQITLIASENYTSKEVRQATGSVLTNKYAEGYPGKRYYAGCEYVDQIETIAIERCKKLFNAEHANVQPHAGCQANMAVYFAAIKPGDTIMGMSLAEGGHLTHGHPVNFSGTYFNRVQYTLNRETELLDFDQIEELAHKHKPKLIIAGASAYSRMIDFEKFGAIARSVNALFLADMAHIAGLVAAGLHPSPVNVADFVSSTTHKTLRGPRGAFVLCKAGLAESVDKAVIPGTQGGPFMHTIAAKAIGFKQAMEPSFKIYQQQVIKNAQAMARTFIDLGYKIVTDGTDNHLFIVDLRNKNITGRQAELVLEQAGISSSRSCIPFDPAKPWVTSGIRFGTPAVTTRGMKETDVIGLAHLIDEVINNHQNEKIIESVKNKVRELCRNLPGHI